MGLKLDEIEAANSFPMLPMTRNGLKWPVMSPFWAYVSRIFHVIFQYLSVYHSSSNHKSKANRENKSKMIEHFRKKKTVGTLGDPWGILGGPRIFSKMFKTREKMFSTVRLASGGQVHKVSKLGFRPT